MSGRDRGHGKYGGRSGGRGGYHREDRPPRDGSRDFYTGGGGDRSSQYYGGGGDRGSQYYGGAEGDRGSQYYGGGGGHRSSQYYGGGGDRSSQYHGGDRASQYYGGGGDRGSQEYGGGHYGPGQGDRGGHYGSGGSQPPRSSGYGTGQRGRDDSAGYGGRGRGGGGGGGRGGGGRGPDLSGIQEVSTNMLEAQVDKHFEFFQYTIECADKDGRQIENRFRRADLFRTGFWNGVMKQLNDQEKKEWMRIVFFQGGFFFSTREVPELHPDRLPLDLATSEGGEVIRCVRRFHYTIPQVLQEATKESDVLFHSYRCANCTAVFSTEQALIHHCQSTGHGQMSAPNLEDATPSSPEIFLSYVNTVVSRAFDERYQRWGRHFVDMSKGTNQKGCIVYPAYGAEFSILRINKVPSLVLTLDVRTKIIRDRSLWDEIYDNGKRQNLTPMDEQAASAQWIGQVVIYKNERKCYTVTNLDFSNSARTLMIPDLGISHEEYFRKKGIRLEHPNDPPMVALPGRRNQTIHLPAELVMGNDLDPQVREQLPMIASFQPQRRREALEILAKFLVPGAQTTKGASGLLPVAGITLSNNRLQVPVSVLPPPQLQIAGMRVAATASFGRAINGARFNVRPGEVNELQVVLVCHQELEGAALGVYNRLQKLVNNYEVRFRVGPRPITLINAGNNDNTHIRALDDFFSRPIPENVFVLDFVLPRGKRLDSAYPIIKGHLGRGGHLSQFVNFATCRHDRAETRRSQPILQGVARQMLQKCGARLWWTSIPRELQLPSIIVGVDISHAPFAYDPATKQRDRKASCAAVVVEVLRGSEEDKRRMEIYCRTFKRQGGEEFDLKEAISETVSRAMAALNVQPQSAIFYRDGIGQSTFGQQARDEIAGVRSGLEQSAGNRRVPLSYIVCQKGITTKLLVEQGDKTFGAPSGTLVSSVEDMDYETFYLNGTAPPFSTPKPTRFTVLEKDPELSEVNLTTLTHSRCYDYPNWTGPIKLPATVRMAHKLAELAGQFDDCGEGTNADRYAGQPYFL